MIQSLWKAFILLAVATPLVGCFETGTPSTEGAATEKLINLGVLRLSPENLMSNKPIVELGVPMMGQTNFVATTATCEGAAGSVVPPLAFVQCTAGVAYSPLRAIGDVLGQPGARTVTLQGLERFHVYQREDNLCWAAALEMVRGYLHLPHIPHKTMPDIVARDCPKLSNQPIGANLLQIGYTIAKITRDYDHGRLPPHTCVDEACIVAAISHGRPVIAFLHTQHAIVIQGLEIAGGSRDMIQKYFVVDPGVQGGKIEVRDALEMCTADAFFAF